MKGLVHRVTGLLGGRNGNGESGETDDAGEPAGLFQCEDCDTTYISREMNSCPECSQSVESVPTETDLGMA